MSLAFEKLQISNKLQYHFKTFSAVTLKLSPKRCPFFCLSIDLMESETLLKVGWTKIVGATDFLIYHKPQGKMKNQDSVLNILKK